ncbi:hypothetical protein LCGC14_1124660 [marine sediment metagenome]|uniref:Uncharacterized protein n=1 Tax=marine sediment metagenome TaxID=412755 RepID=A0A0F9K1H3_9ZZZZ
MTDKHTPEDTIANYTAALGKRLNEIRRLKGVNAKLLEALEDVVRLLTVVARQKSTATHIRMKKK